MSADEKDNHDLRAHVAISCLTDEILREVADENSASALWLLLWRDLSQIVCIWNNGSIPYKWRR